MNTELEVVDQETAIEVREIDSNVLAVSQRADIDAQVATARAFPRSVTRALQESLTLATMDKDTAASMFYRLPRGYKDGKRQFIEGPSARLAEVMQYAWGNMRSSGEVVGTEDRFIVSEGTAFDCEKNVAVRVRVKRRITDSYGKRYSDDMIGVTGQAAVSIALRNARLQVIPAAFVKRIYEAARRASLGEGTIESKRAAALAWFARVGKQEADVFELLGIAGLDDMGEEELINLRGFVTSVQDGAITVEQLFAKKEQSEGATSLNGAIPKKDAAPPPPPAKDATEKTSATKKDKAKAPKATEDTTPEPAAEATASAADTPPVAEEPAEETRPKRSRPQPTDVDDVKVREFLDGVPQREEEEAMPAYIKLLDDYFASNVNGWTHEEKSIAEAFLKWTENDAADRDDKMKDVDKERYERAKAIQAGGAS